MIEDRHRFGYALFIIILVGFVGYFFDISWLSSQIHELQEEVSKEQEVLNEMEANLKKKEEVNKEKILDVNLHPQNIDELTECFKNSDLKLRTMTSLSKLMLFGQQIDHVRVTTTGTYAALKELMVILKKRIPRVLLSDFSFEVKDSHDSLFSMDFWLWQNRSLPFQESWGHLEVGENEHDPMCVSSNELIADSAYRVSQIELLAVIFEEGQEKAIVELPDGNLLTVTKGMMLGLDRGKVVKIEYEAMDVMLQNNEKIRIWRKGMQK